MKYHKINSDQNHNLLPSSCHKQNKAALPTYKAGDLPIIQICSVQSHRCQDTKKGCNVNICFNTLLKKTGQWKSSTLHYITYKFIMRKRIWSAVMAPEWLHIAGLQVAIDAKVCETKWITAHEDNVTCRPVGRCFASLTLAKLPLPMVLIRRYFPMCGSSALRPAGDPIRVLSSDVWTTTALCIVNITHCSTRDDI